jgi:hypothetical protein
MKSKNECTYGRFVDNFKVFPLHYLDQVAVVTISATASTSAAPAATTDTATTSATSATESANQGSTHNNNSNNKEDDGEDDGEGEGLDEEQYRCMAVPLRKILKSNIHYESYLADLEQQQRVFSLSMTSMQEVISILSSIILGSYTRNIQICGLWILLLLIEVGD